MEEIILNFISEDKNQILPNSEIFSDTLNAKLIFFNDYFEVFRSYNVKFNQLIINSSNKKSGSEIKIKNIIGFSKMVSLSNQ